MQRLAKPSDYILQDVLGRASYVLPWETRLCPGNPADDPESGAIAYNEHALERAQNGGLSAVPDPVGDAVDLALKTSGEAYRALAGDLAAAYLGQYQFSLNDWPAWDNETKTVRADLSFCKLVLLRDLTARQVMDLRARSAQA